MNPETFRARTKSYALRVIAVVDALPRDQITSVLGRQLLRSGTSVAANYRASARAKSHADFVAKMSIVEEECDESLFWMELLIESRRIRPECLHALMREGTELLAMSVASIKTARKSRHS